jgi:hypothetical protein
MSSRVFVPFDNNPTDKGINFNDYTVPDNKFAYLKIRANDGYLLLNGSVLSWFTSGSTISISSGNLSTSFVDLYTVPTDRAFNSLFVRIQRTDTTGGTATYEVRSLSSSGIVKAVITASADSTSVPKTVDTGIIAVIPGDKIQARVTNANFNGVGTRTILTQNNNKEIYIENWYKSGDVISFIPISNTSFCHIEYTEYKAIS